MEHTGQIGHLIIKHVRKELSEEENSQLQDWLKEDIENQRFFDSITTQDTLQKKVQDYTHFSLDENELWERTVALGLPAKTARQRPIFWRYAAAAVTIGLIVSYLLWMPRSTMTKMPEASKVNASQELLPGGNKATLTLANGEAIALDDAKVGELAKQGSTSVMKLDSGQLAYNAGEGAAAASYNTLTTPRGGQYQITLPDGSRIWLNSASSVRFPVAFTGVERKIEITGEVYCEIAHDVQRPFKVLAGDAEIEVLGTSFNINAYSDEMVIKTTLLNGSIKLKATDKSYEGVLKPGQQATVPQKDGAAVNVTSGVDLNQVVAWKNGYFAFDSEPIPAIMRQLARWYDLEVVYQGSAPDVVFSGKIYRNTNAKNILLILESLGVNFKIDGKRITVLPKATT